MSFIMLNPFSSYTDIDAMPMGYPIIFDPYEAVGLVALENLLPIRKAVSGFGINVVIEGNSKDVEKAVVLFEKGVVPPVEVKIGECTKVQNPTTKVDITKFDYMIFLKQLNTSTGISTCFMIKSTEKCLNGNIKSEGFTAKQILLNNLRANLYANTKACFIIDTIINNNIEKNVGFMFDDKNNKVTMVMKLLLNVIDDDEHINYENHNKSILKDNPYYNVIDIIMKIDDKCTEYLNASYIKELITPERKTDPKTNLKSFVFSKSA